jgi:HlyD family secretion protein
MLIKHGNADLRPLATLFQAGAIGGLTDGQLLERFAGDRGEPANGAFAELIARHGRLVLGVCRSVLQNEHDVEEAFQATFLVLVAKSRSLYVRDSLGPWLHQVALRAARNARSTAMRRRVHEARAVRLARHEFDPGFEPRPEFASLHEAIDRLPERYRAAIVLCDLEGQSQELAARQLGCPIGTLKSRLSRARCMLRDRLSRSGCGLVLAILLNCRVSQVSCSPRPPARRACFGLVTRSRGAARLIRPSLSRREFGAC